MVIDWKKSWYYGKEIFFFFLGVLFVHILSSMIISSPLSEILHEITEAEIRDFIANIDKEIFSSLIKIYVISFILFYFLPPKINKSKWYLRSLFFVIFYLFCILIYLWI